MVEYQFAGSLTAVSLVGAHVSVCIDEVAIRRVGTQDRVGVGISIAEIKAETWTDFKGVLFVRFPLDTEIGAHIVSFVGVA